MTADYERTYAHKFRDTLPNLMCHIVAIEVPPPDGCHMVTVRSLKDICCVLAHTHTHLSPVHPFLRTVWPIQGILTLPRPPTLACIQ